MPLRISIQCPVVSGGYLLALFCKLVALILGKNCVKSLRVPKTVKQIKFKGVWGELEAKNCFQIQSWSKYTS